MGSEIGVHVELTEQTLEGWRRGESVLLPAPPRSLWSCHERATRPLCGPGSTLRGWGDERLWRNARVSAPWAISGIETSLSPTRDKSSLADAEDFPIDFGQLPMAVGNQQIAAVSQGGSRYSSVASQTLLAPTP